MTGPFRGVVFALPPTLRIWAAGMSALALLLAFLP